jgi:hypothetical protein
MMIMTEKLGSYLCEYILSRVGVFKKYIIAASMNKDHCVFYLESSGGMMIPSSDRKNCELLRDARIFTEDTKFSHSGRNIYKFYCLTETGKKIAEAMRAENQMTEENEEVLPSTSDKVQH